MNIWDLIKKANETFPLEEDFDLIGIIYYNKENNAIDLIVEAKNFDYLDKIHKELMIDNRDHFGKCYLYFFNEK